MLLMLFVCLWLWLHTGGLGLQLTAVCELRLSTPSSLHVATYTQKHGSMYKYVYTVCKLIPVRVQSVKMLDIVEAHCCVVRKRKKFF